MSGVLVSVARGSEELRFEAALRAIGIYQRARLIRRLAVMLTVAIAIVRLALFALCVPLGDKSGVIPMLMGISLLASFFSISLEWSTRAQCRDAMAGCYSGDPRAEASPGS